MKTESIIVMLITNWNPLFVITDISKDSFTEERLRKVILNHWEYLFGKGNVKILQKEKDYIINADNECFSITWSWVTSYKG